MENQVTHHDQINFICQQLIEIAPRQDTRILAARVKDDVEFQVTLFHFMSTLIVGCPHVAELINKNALELYCGINKLTRKDDDY